MLMCMFDSSSVPGAHAGNHIRHMAEADRRRDGDRHSVQVHV